MLIENEIEIEAPPETVWRITADVQSWPDWCPTMETVTRLEDGPFGLGSKARIKQPGLRPAEWQVASFSEGKAFTWETRIRGIHMAATHELIPSDTGTRNILRLNVSGILAVLLWPLLRGSLSNALLQENAGLKVRCESIAKDCRD